MGRSRGGSSSKLHAVIDDIGMPLSIVLTGGQRHDGTILIEILDDFRVPLIGPGHGSMHRWAIEHIPI